MPIYEYCCNTCGASFEIITRLSEAKYAPLCPQCGSEDTRKKLSTFASSSGSSSSPSYSSGSSCGSHGSFS